MLWKIVLIVTLSFAQSYSEDKVAATTPITSQKVNVKSSQKITDAATQDVPADFVRIAHEMNDLEDRIIMGVVNVLFNKTHPKIIGKCFEQQKQNFMKFSTQLDKLLLRDGKEIRQDVQEMRTKIITVEKLILKLILETVKKVNNLFMGAKPSYGPSDAFKDIKEIRQLTKETFQKTTKILYEMSQDLSKTPSIVKEMNGEILGLLQNDVKTVIIGIELCLKKK